MKLTLVLVAAALATGAAGCSGDSDEDTAAAAAGSPAGEEVSIGTFQYMPKDLSIDAGTTVTWTNDDAILHTVTTSGDAPEAFDLQLKDKGATASFTFDKPGTYTYVCSVHPGMQATVSVS